MSFQYDSCIRRYAGAGAVVLGCYGSIILLQNYRKKDEAPHVWSWLPFIGSAIQFGSDPLAFLRAQIKKHGDVFTAVVGGERMVFICDHSNWNSVFRASNQLKFEPVARQVVSSAFQIPRFKIDHLFSSPAGHALSAQLKTLMAGAHLETLAATSRNSLTNAFKRMYRRASSCDAQGYMEVPMYSSVSRAMSDATLETFFGADFVNDDIANDFVNFDARFAYLAAGVPGFLFPCAMKALSGLCRAIDAADGSASPISKLVRERTRLLSKLEDEGVINREMHCKLQVVIIWAQLANTLPASFWTLYHLLKHPDALAAVRAELAAAAAAETAAVAVAAAAAGKAAESRSEEAGGGTSISILFNTGELSRFPVLHSCILESLRLSTGSMTVREVTEPYLLPTRDSKGVHLRVGDRVAIFPPLLHTNEKLFGSDPHLYVYRRFLSQNENDQQLNHLSREIMPFGGGVSLCPGRHFAKCEIAQFVAGMLLDFDVLLHPDSADGVAPQIDQSRVGLGIYPPIDDSVRMLFRLKCKQG